MKIKQLRFDDIPQCVNGRVLSYHRGSFKHYFWVVDDGSTTRISNPIPVENGMVYRFGALVLDWRVLNGHYLLRMEEFTGEEVMERFVMLWGDEEAGMRFIPMSFPQSLDVSHETITVPKDSNIIGVLPHHLIMMGGSEGDGSVGLFIVDMCTAPEELDFEGRFIGVAAGKLVFKNNEEEA